MALAKAVIESQLTTRFGDVFKLNERRFTEVLPTGVTEIDSLTGGLPRGAITEIFGLASSGRTSLMLSAFAHVTTHEEVCALIDTNNSFDPKSASKAGTDLDQLLWLRCDGKLEHAFKAADLILQGGHARLQQESLLLFQLDLQAHAVPDFQLDHDYRDRGRIDQQVHPARVRGVRVTGNPAERF